MNIDCISFGRPVGDAAQASQVVAMRVTGTPTPSTGTAGGAVLVIPNTLLFDTHGGYNPATGRYTVSVPGYYAVSCYFNATSSAYIQLYLNGTMNHHIGLTGASGPTSGVGTGFGIVKCNVGDVLDVRPSGPTGGWGTGNTTLAIFRIG